MTKMTSKISWKEDEKLRRVLKQNARYNVGVSYLYQLKGLLDEKNVAGVFLSREKPTKPMVKFAKESGVYRVGGLYSQKPFPKLQILTLEQMLKGKCPDLPYKYAA